MTAGVVAMPTMTYAAKIATDTPLRPSIFPPTAAPTNSRTAKAVSSTAAREMYPVARAENAQRELGSQAQDEHAGDADVQRHFQGEAQLAGDRFGLGRRHREQD